METPTQSAVAQEVKQTIYMFSRYPVHLLKEEYELQGRPLRMDKIKLLQMTKALRAYVRIFKSENTLKPSEVRKPDVTVKALCELIYKRIK